MALHSQIAHPDVQVCPKKMCQMSRFADVFHNQCGVSHISHWPENLRDDELAWAANEDDPASSTGPIYRAGQKSGPQVVRVFQAS